MKLVKVMPVVCKDVIKVKLATLNNLKEQKCFLEPFFYLPNNAICDQCYFTVLMASVLLDYIEK